MATSPPAGTSPAYQDGWNDAAADRPIPAGASPAYASGWDDYHTGPTTHDNDDKINQNLDNDATCTSCHHTGSAHDEDGCHTCMDYCIFNTGVPTN